MPEPFPCFTASGSPRELGRQHGEQAAAHIAAHLDYLRQQLGQTAGQVRSQALRFERLFADSFPRLLEEIRGLAEGARIAFADALALQIRGELAAERNFQDGCTTFVVGRRGTRTGKVYIGQTSDTPSEFERLAYVLRLNPDDRPPILMWTFGGMLGYHGFNSHGVAHFANSLGGGPAWRFALPHYPLKRALLECENLDAALSIFQRIPVCSSGNYVLCDGRGEILDVEVTPVGLHVLRDEGAGFLVHSNHFLCGPHAVERNFNRSLPDSFPRLDRIRSLVQSRFGQIGLEDMQRFLSDHEGHPVGICRHSHDGPGNDVLPCSGKTVAALVAEPEAGRMQVARGNPCENPFIEYRLDACERPV